MSLKWTSYRWEGAPLLCRLFGHRWQSGWWGDEPYLKAQSGPIDGIDEHHIRLKCRCRHCDEEFIIANIHESNIRKVLRKEKMAKKNIDLEARVRSVIAEVLAVDLPKVVDGANMIDDLGADSLDTIEVVMGLEEEFGIAIDDAMVEEVQTVGDVIKLCRTLIGEPA